MGTVEIALVSGETILLALITLLVGGLLRSHAELLRLAHDRGLEATSSPGERNRPYTVGRANGIGGEIGRIAGRSVNGAEIIVDTITDDGNVLLAFLSSNCAACEQFWVGLGQGPVLPGPTRTVIVGKDDPDDSADALRQVWEADGAPLILSSETWRDQGIPGSPYFLLVERGTGRVIGEGSAGNWDQLQGLFAQSGIVAGAAA